MNNNHFSDSLFEAVFRQAVIDDFEQRLNEIPSNEELAKTITFSERHEARMKGLFARESRKERVHAAAKWIKRVAAAFAIAITLLFGILMTVPEIRAVVVETIVQWFEQFTKFTSGSPVQSETSWEPTYIPEGFSESARHEANDFTSISYTNILGETLFFNYVPAVESISVNNEGVTYHQVVSGNIVYHTFTANNNEEMSSVVWDMDGYRFIIQAYIQIPQLLEMAQSVE